MLRLNNPIPKSKKNSKPLYDLESKSRARYSQKLADLLWLKVCNSSTPEVKEMLVVYLHLEEISRTVVPEDAEPMSYSFESIAKAAEEAEQLLTRATPETPQPALTE